MTAEQWAKWCGGKDPSTREKAEAGLVLIKEDSGDPDAYSIIEMEMDQ